MAWCWPGDKPLSQPMMVRLSKHIWVTLPQWVNSLRPCDAMWHQRFWLLIHIDSGNVSSPVKCQIIQLFNWTNADLLSSRPLGIYICEIWIKTWRLFQEIVFENVIFENVFCQFFSSFNVFRSCYSICLPLMRHHLFCAIWAVIESVIYSYRLGHLSWPIGDWLQSDQGHKWCIFWLSLWHA